MAEYLCVWKIWIRMEIPYLSKHQTYDIMQRTVGQFDAIR